VTYASAMPGLRWPALPGPRGLMRLALLQQLGESQWWPPERIRARQLEQLDALVAHARAHSPFYAERLAHLPPQLDEAHWQALPILERETVQAEAARLRCDAYPREHGARQALYTSGSTGTPVATEQTELCQLFWEAFTLRDHYWHGRDFSGKLAALRHFPAGTLAQGGGRGPNWGKATEALVVTGPVTMLDVSATTAEQLAWLAREDPDYLLVHPTVLRELLDAWAQGARRPASLRQVRTISEALPEGLRALCREVLGVPMTDLYSTREAGYLALQCPEHEHYHVQSENARVEILDEAGRPCGPGEVGRVVVTPLHNFAFPLLRYAIGDYAEVGDACPCGRGLPVIKRILGRQRNMLTYPDGRRVWPILHYRALSRLHPVRQMRMTQHSLERIEVELVTSVRPDADKEAELVAFIREKLGHPFLVQFSYPERIERSPGGKFEDFVSRVH